MTDKITEFLAESKRLEKAATPGPWEHGDRQMVAGVSPDHFGEGRCAYCHHGEPSWVGKRNINGKRMLAHVHEETEPTWKHGIYAYREDGSLLVVNDTDEYGYMLDPDAEFIAHARTALPKMREALEAVLDYCASIPEPYYPDGRPESSTYRAGAYDTALEIVGRIESALGGFDDD